MFHTDLELQGSQTVSRYIDAKRCFILIWNYKALKRYRQHQRVVRSFILIWNYKALKPQIASEVISEPIHIDNMV